MLDLVNAMGLTGPITEKLATLDRLFYEGKVGVEQKKKDGKFTVIIDGKEVVTSLAAVKSAADALGWELTVPAPLWTRKV